MNPTVAGVGDAESLPRSEWWAALGRSSTLAQEAYRTLRRAIREGALVPGEVYSEAHISRMLGVSRTPVREAVIELAHQGIVSKHPQRGFELRQVGEREVREVYDLRRAVETYVARRLASEATPDQTATLEGHITDQEHALREVREFDPVAFAEAGEAFHLAMPSVIGLHRSAETLETMRGLLWLSGIASFAHSSRPSEAIEEHRRILEAVRRHNADEAEGAVINHLEQTARARPSTG